MVQVYLSQHKLRFQHPPWQCFWLRMISSCNMRLVSSSFHQNLAAVKPPISALLTFYCWCYLKTQLSRYDTGNSHHLLMFVLLLLPALLGETAHRLLLSYSLWPQAAVKPQQPDGDHCQPHSNKQLMVLGLSFTNTIPQQFMFKFLLCAEACVLVTWSIFCREAVNWYKFRQWTQFCITCITCSIAFQHTET